MLPDCPVTTTAKVPAGVRVTFAKGFELPPPPPHAAIKTRAANTRTVFLRRCVATNPANPAINRIAEGNKLEVLVVVTLSAPVEVIKHEDMGAGSVQVY
jgi:hypothetical protein